MVTPTLILPRQGGGKFFRELDAPQLCCGILHYGLLSKSLIPGFFPSEKGTWVHLFHPPVEGKLLRGVEGLDVGERVGV